jgi:fatty acid desaturase
LPRLRKQDNSTRAQKIARLAYYLGIAAVLTLTGAWMGFVLYWAVPWITVFFLFLYIRSVAEHFGSMEYEDDLTDTRTTIPYFWERWFFGPHNINYHIEHHLYPSVPFFNLPELHAELMKDPHYAERAHVTRGYSAGLVRECLTWAGKPDPEHTQKTPAE